MPAITPPMVMAEVMFAFMNAESLAHTLKTKKATYWSRSRVHPVAGEGGVIEAFVFVQADLTLEHRLNAERGRLAEWFGAVRGSSAPGRLPARRDLPG